MSGLGMLTGSPEATGDTIDPLGSMRTAELSVPGPIGVLGSELEPELLQRPPAPPPPPPSAVLTWLREFLQWADSLGGAK